MNPPDEPVKPTQTPTSDNECPALVPKGTSVPEANVDHLLGVGLEREKTYVSCAFWLNKWLSGDHNPDLSYDNRCYPKSLAALSMDQIKGDHMLIFAGRFGKFFANNSLRKVKGAGVLDASTKFVYFKIRFHKKMMGSDENERKDALTLGVSAGLAWRDDGPEISLALEDGPSEGSS